MSATVPTTLARLQPWRSGMALAADWAVIALCFGAAMLYPHPAVYALAIVVIARTQLALAVMMHEGAHRLLAHPQSRNDIVAQALAAGPLFLSLFAYRQGHLQHHRAPMSPDDPVAIMFGIADYPVSRRELTLRLLRDVTGIGYVLAIRGALRWRGTQPASAHTRTVPQRAGLVAGTILLSNGLLFGVLAALGHPLLYLGLWLLPALTLLQLFARIRAITEHAGYAACEDQRHSARTIVARSWQTFFCGPHGIHYHIEHHQHVRVPFYQLPALHRWMHAQDQLPAANLYHGYGAVLRDVSRGARSDDQR
ncbi:fatty acid desaturase family protein [Xanthomonas campestris]|uniref:fatty acid desaturase family protein n=1 Tax=Xanthomonas campestris TaxID=339 RepID=UPI002B22BA08|nr:fatty acid desaturase family protein [Xanthomonas campestris]MEA9772366.1 fatty acid desaturase family protein [Xanthomonas campestris pv. raphani]MEA9800745.1 fatty acid desaturase family protein [Xanthomonas campestris pv. raphani]MEA9833496.1 fatty acid desaturase family protein [Xanthomonas campestris pv. raphani]MEA9921460.1 fatty acid desaturase family protein [Xanthomonas campestris pv. raphani]MEA9949669.1 fatty acid desaturase family protein [Xanthomonas campestris pv. raphani]